MSIVARRLFSECLGTFFLVFVDCGGAVIASLSGDSVTPEGRSLATGLLIMAMILAMGDVSGAHFNPSATLAFALRRVFPWRMVPFYWLAQISGAFAAAWLLRAIFGDSGELGATEPGFGIRAAFATEVLLTTILVSVSLGTATRHRVIGPNAALAVGGVVALCGLFARPASGASMNPARSLAPAVLSGHTGALWIYLTAPLLGALSAIAIMEVVHVRKHPEEIEAASGEQK